MRRCVRSDFPIMALEEEIGQPEMITGRTKDLKHFLEWTEMAKRKQSLSHVILARKRRGKTCAGWFCSGALCRD